MSADVKSVPPWKLALIEKKRRQEEEDRQRRKEEEERITQMPTWKRDILLKKQQQKNSLVFFAKPNNSPKSDIEVSSLNHETSEHSSFTVDSNVNIDNHNEQVPDTNHDGFDSSVILGPSEEHIIPIQQNPWLRTDIKQRNHSRSTSRPSAGSESDKIGHSYNSLPRNLGSASWREPGDEHDAEEGDDEIFNDDQEVAYGRGFVHKLLKRFKHLSARDEKAPTTVTTGPKRAHSTENILEEAPGSAKSSPRHHITSGSVSDGRPTGIYASPVKARSMENLAGSKHAYSNLDVQIGTDRHDCTQGSLDGSFSSGSMQSPRSISGSEPSNHVDVVDDDSFLVHDKSTAEADEPPALKRYGSSENLIEDELPRANIVSSTRSLFENVTGTRAQNKPRGKTLSPRVESLEFRYPPAGSSSPREAAERSLPNGSARQDELWVDSEVPSGYAYGSVSGGESGDGASVRSGIAQEVNSKDGNDRNANYKSDNSGILTESRTSTKGPAVARPKTDQSSVNGGSISASVQESSIHSSQSIMQKNYHNNNRLSTSSAQASHQSAELISPDKGGSKSEYNPAINSKKRRAPLPPSSRTEDTAPHPSVVQVQEDESVLRGGVPPKKPNLYLDLGADSRGPKATGKEGTPSYRDLYFSRGSESPATSSPSVISPGTAKAKEVSPTENTQELVNTDIGGSQRNGVLESAAISSASQVSDSQSGPKPAQTIISNSSDALKPAPLEQPKGSRPATAPATSKAANGHAASLTLPIPKAGEGVTLNNKAVGAKKANRPAAGGSSSPGSLLIRPASNLVPTATGNTTQLANIKRYNDVKSGVFQPPKANPSYLEGLADEFDIPVTNIDDVMDDVPVTNIDDLGDLSSDSSPRLEQDADKERRVLSSKYDFVGAGVTTSKNLLVKTRTQKMRITFNDLMTSTYEYPSEQSMLEEMPPEPGDFDYIQHANDKGGPLAAAAASLARTSGDDDDEDDEAGGSGSGGALMSTPGLGSAGGLGSYRSRYAGDYQLGVDLYSEKKTKETDDNKQTPKQQEIEDVQVKPAEDADGYNWSDAQSADLLF